jgi:hypothetical protein
VIAHNNSAPTCGQGPSVELLFGIPPERKTPMAVIPMPSAGDCPQNSAPACGQGASVKLMYSSPPNLKILKAMIPWPTTGDCPQNSAPAKLRTCLQSLVGCLGLASCVEQQAGDGVRDYAVVSRGGCLRVASCVEQRRLTDCLMRLQQAWTDALCGQLCGANGRPWVALLGSLRSGGCLGCSAQCRASHQPYVSF